MVNCMPAGHVVVGVGDLGVGRGPGAQVVTYALGSCVGVFAWHPVARVGACLHYLLPDNPGAGDPLKYGDTGISALLRAVAPSSRELHRLRIVAAGGANLHRDIELFRIGERNVATLRRELAVRGLALAAQDLGGDRPRTARLDVGTGRVEVTSGGRRLLL